MNINDNRLSSLLRPLRIAGAVFHTFLCSATAVVWALIGRIHWVEWMAWRIWARGILRIGGIRLTHEIAHGVDLRGGAILLSNHQSHLDIPAICAATRTMPRFVAKAELFRIPIFGRAMELNGHIKVNRGNREEAIRSMREAAAQLAGADFSVLVFAEGTRSPDGHLQSFKKGGFLLAVETGRPIVPVVVEGGRFRLPAHTLRLTSGRMHVRLLEPVSVEGHSADHLEPLVQEVRQRISSALEHCEVTA